MNKILLFAITILGLSKVVFSQECNLSIKDGDLTKLKIITYTNPLSGDPKFLKAKEDKKDEMVAAYNASVLAGTVPPASNYTMEFHIKKNKLKDADEYQIGYNVGGKDYFSYLVCRADTLFLARNRGPVLVGTEENPIGYSLQGIQILPMKLKVGDVLPTFEDISFTFPTSTDLTVKKKVFSHYSTSSSNGFGYAPNSNGDYVLGPTIELKTRAVYNTIDVAVRQNLSFSAHSIQGVNQTVTGVEEVTISGVKYKAYIIESESWTKGKMNTNYESADEEVAKEQEKAAARLQAKGEKLMIKKQFTNKLGYMVLFSKGWYVPELGGAVKTESYDIFGGIASIMKSEGLE